MSTRDQLVKRTSDLATQPNLGPVDGKEVAGVYNVQFTSVPNHGDIFAVGPMQYRMVSAGSTAYDTTGMAVAYNTDVSTAASAFSAAINLATSKDGQNNAASNIGSTAVTAAGSTSDITVTAAIAGNSNKIVISASVSGIVVSESTATVGGKTLPEGFLEYVTSAGNKIRVNDPAELTRVQVQFPSKRN